MVCASVRKSLCIEHRKPPAWNVNPAQRCRPASPSTDPHTHAGRRVLRATLQWCTTRATWQGQGWPRRSVPSTTGACSKVPPSLCLVKALDRQCPMAVLRLHNNAVPASSPFGCISKHLRRVSASMLNTPSAGLHEPIHPTVPENIREEVYGVQHLTALGSHTKEW